MRLNILHKYIIYIISISADNGMGVPYFEIKSYPNVLVYTLFLRNCSQFCNNSSLHFEKF